MLDRQGVHCSSLGPSLARRRGQHVEGAAPSYPVEILGLNSVPVAGDEFRVFEDERDARKLAEERALRARLAEQETKSHMNLDDLFSREDFDSLKHLAALWDAYWARRHDVNEPVTK